ncbi:MAG: hypothetical protein HY266_08685 [Deltaproteobacteria bacterium]|nr:hypothetical protein [Deltaproteobacteria bacterium]
MEERLVNILLDIKADIGGLKKDVGDMKKGQMRLEADVSELKADVSTLKADVSELKTDVAVLKEDIALFNRNLRLRGQEGHPLKGTVSREKSSYSKKNDFFSLNMLDEITTVLPLQ